MYQVMDRKKARRAFVVKYLREMKKEKVARLANELGYSYHYFKYSVLPEVLGNVDCIRYDKKDDILLWICDSDSNDSEKSAEEIVDEFFERLESARPVSG